MAIDYEENKNFRFNYPEKGCVFWKEKQVYTYIFNGSQLSLEQLKKKFYGLVQFGFLNEHSSVWKDGLKIGKIDHTK